MRMNLVSPFTPPPQCPGWTVPEPWPCAVEYMSANMCACMQIVECESHYGRSVPSQQHWPPKRQFAEHQTGGSPMADNRIQPQVMLTPAI